MSYPTLPADAVIRFVELLRTLDGPPDFADVLEFLGTNQVPRETNDADLTALEECASELDGRLAELGPDPGRKLEALEGEFCGRVHASLAMVPIEILDDPAFWSYISIRYFWRFVLAREYKSLKKLLGRPLTGDDDDAPDLPLRRYFDGTDVYQIPLRLYVRAQAIKDGDDYSLAAAVVNGTDFWRSHVVRVSTSYYPSLSRALARAQVENALPTEPLRSAAKRVNRYRANMHPVLLDDEDQDGVVGTFWSEA